jgi:hypothetical protein
MRIIGTLLLELDDDWQAERVYLDMREYLASRDRYQDADGEVSSKEVGAARIKAA